MKEKVKEHKIGQFQHITGVTLFIPQLHHIICVTPFLLSKNTICVTIITAQLQHKIHVVTPFLCYV
jgi:hypothetical protein